jgi:5'(3')-deoxyribonucleotidase
MWRSLIDMPTNPHVSVASGADRASVHMVILVDMDDVIADVLSQQILLYNREFNERLAVNELRGKWIWDFVPTDRVRALERQIRSDDFFERVAVIPHSQRVLEGLQRHYDVYIATSVMEYPQAFLPKYEWLKRHFPFIPPSHIFFCGDKGIVRGDYLIDDNPRELRLFRGKAIIYSSPANALVREFRRVNGWLDVEQLFMGHRTPSTTDENVKVSHLLHERLR